MTPEELKHLEELLDEEREEETPPMTRRDWIVIALVALFIFGMTFWYRFHPAPDERD